LGKLEDLHVDRNELDAQWVDQQDWELRRHVTLAADELGKSRQQLIFEGIDTVATVFLNGDQVAKSVNMFRRVVADVRGKLRPGKNEIRIVIASPTAYAAAQAKRHQYRVKIAESFSWQTGEKRDLFRPWIRKAQCHFGWDWGLCLPSSGMWQPARLECSNAPRIDSVTTVQEHEGRADAPRRVRLKLTARLDAAVAGSGKLVARCGDQSADTDVRLLPGENQITLELVLERPRLWWPHGAGEQALYTLDVRYVDDGSENAQPLKRRIGLRTVELIRNSDRTADGEPAESFYFRINGRAIFAKGANWIPPDQFVERCTHTIYEHLLKSAVQANMNMLRVWGGGWYEQRHFYELCDELGLMVWQDFMMACALYPDGSEFVEELCAEARHQIRRLSDHASIVIWCGDNENAEGVAHWWRKAPHAAQNAEIYSNVLTALESVCRVEDTTRPFWYSSPSNGSLGEERPNDPNRGDVHYWAVWHGGKPFTDYLGVKPRFASEFGFQSFPEPRTIEKVVRKSERNPSSFVMEHHQRSHNGNMLITNTIARELPIFKDFEAYCFLSQINQAMAVKTAVEHWRRLKPWCMGTLFWQLDDLWPVASWSSIDYYGRWKVLQHAAARFYAPLLASIVREDDKISVWATSDVDTKLQLRGALELLTWSGKRVAQVPIAGELEADASRSLVSTSIAKLTSTKLHQREVCAFVTLESDGLCAENFSPLTPFKWANLAEPRLSTELSEKSGSLELKVRAKSVVPFFHAELQGHEGRFEGDWDTLRPGRAYRFRWVSHRDAKMPNLAKAERRLRTLSLHDLFEH
jgi:beta-mannosidase